MDTQAILKRLFLLGHFRNPAMPTGITKTEQLESLSLTSAATRTALRSYQEFLPEDFDRLSNAIHGRPGIPDGDPGPATMQLLELPRCGHPDFPEGAEPATGRGSWPAGCWAEFPNHHAFGVYWDYDGMPSYLRPIIEECIDRCYAAFRDIGIAFFTSTNRQSCNTRASFTRGRGWIGLAIVPSNPTCRTNPIWAQFDNRYQPRNLVDQWSRLLTHEFGHNMGLHHSRGGVMNPSITSGPFTRTAWRGDPSEPTLRRWFGGDPVPDSEGPQPPGDPDPDPPDNPDPPDPPSPPDGTIRVSGTITVELPGQPPADYMLVPKIRV